MIFSLHQFESGSPLSLFVWTEKRIVPVRVTEFSITEEAFLPNLSPIRAKITLALRVLSVLPAGVDLLATVVCTFGVWLCDGICDSRSVKFGKPPVSPRSCSESPGP